MQRGPLAGSVGNSWEGGGGQFRWVGVGETGAQGSRLSPHSFNDDSHSYLKAANLHEKDVLSRKKKKAQGNLRKIDSFGYQST